VVGIVGVFGVIALALTAIGQLVVLAAIIFAPDEPIYERPTESHWTDDIAGVWFFCSVVAIIIALIGVLFDKRRGSAAIALFAAFVGFVWPWGGVSQMNAR
jgi:hypothetical protein